MLALPLLAAAAAVLAPTGGVLSPTAAQQVSQLEAGISDLRCTIELLNLRLAAAERHEQMAPVVSVRCPRLATHGAVAFRIVQLENLLVDANCRADALQLAVGRDADPPAARGPSAAGSPPPQPAWPCPVYGRPLPSKPGPRLQKLRCAISALDERLSTIGDEITALENPSDGPATPTGSPTGRSLMLPAGCRRP
ncbi:MAG TPA: hypothetical protein VFA56_15000 [Gaiellaceae bacterium]|nr:hypothetical protein [Gaiellaceae bacterium]